ncbi:sensor histidine kinase [Stratiformator vulcanicus]|uniref:histidine kinase n=1 Tax=Stratiformator vulcanicus TaxID=2527980 RepID=A0A517R2Z3_9PLAN|nr:HAMP domain-containing sensor histidine kinase [Stratiformator vulcanicus]QDT38234.1 Sensor histidine kinase RegB [Stratiformator vulcanicus]
MSHRWFDILLGRPLATGVVDSRFEKRYAAALRGTAAWLVQLRWVATFGQLITISFVEWVLAVPLPLAPLLTVIGMTAASNVFLGLWSATHPPGDPAVEPAPVTVRVCGPVMLFDLIMLTALLYFSGGAANPFVIFYFVNLSLTTVVLPRQWAWTATSFAIVGFILISFFHRELEPLVSSAAVTRGQSGGTPLVQFGSIVAFIACSITIVYFTMLLRDQLKRHDREIRAYQDEFTRAQKLEALGTLAAGAAHELANPLSTIAVVAREVERRVEQIDKDGRIAKDIALIRTELDQCRGILDRMSLDAGQAMGEELTEVTVDELLSEILSSLRNGDRVRTRLPKQIAQRKLLLPFVVTAQAIRGLIQNAISASPDGHDVTITGSCDHNRLSMNIDDQGEGMSPEVLARVGDPFFTTKEPGSGTGLGVFLARAVVERLGGELRIASTKSLGTTVVVSLPVSPIE